MGAESDVKLLQDRVLADRARHRSRAAFDELYRRHAPASWRLALAVADKADVAETAVATAFAVSLTGATAGVGPATNPVRIEILAAARRAALDASRQAVRDDDAPVGPVREAFDALPERWRSTIWLVDVEGCEPAAAARVVGLDPAGHGSLAERARLGLREQALHSQLTTETPRDCRRTLGRLSAYVAADLAERDDIRVRAHLDSCVECRSWLAGLDDLVPVLRSTALPLPAGLSDLAARRWSESFVRDRGPLRLALPSGEPMPAWAQRTLAGTVAAIVALGITGATLLAGRSRNHHEAERQVAPDGQSALAGPELPAVVLDGSGFPTLSLGTAPGAAPSALPAEIARSAGALSRSIDPAAASDAPLLPRDGLAPPQQPSSPPPPASESGLQATAGVDGVAGATAGDSCVGVQVLDQSIGCTPPATEEPVTVDPGTTALGI